MSQDLVDQIVGDDVETPDVAPPVALTVAGSDSGGGAGLQADLKTFAALGVHGTSALTVVTAQNTIDVSGLEPLPPAVIQSQFEAVVSDFDVAAAKTGATGSEAGVRATADCFESAAVEPIVVDPVMISKHGDPLLPEDAQEAMQKALVPLADLATPNRHEAEILAGTRVSGPSSMREAAKRIHDLGVPNVLIKGGHLDDIVRDYLYDGTGFVEYGADKVDTDRLHGSGCVYSSAITARLAHGDDLEEAIGFAREFITGAIRSAPPLGGGVGPVDPMHGVDV
ncbi:MAG: bifunctional hydroxymethylpyrimidine kinase/phosphomethylpyrimidine kinase [Bradymonadaceae bacterium]